MNAAELLKLLNQEIPISKQMGISVFSVDELSCILKVELKPNLNHKGTGFGGSLYSCCAFAGYGLFLNGLRLNHFSTNDIVIAHGEIQYLLPVDSDFEVKAQWSSDSERKNFFGQLISKKKARTALHVQIHCRGQICAEFKGLFVAKN